MAIDYVLTLQTSSAIVAMALVGYILGKVKIFNYSHIPSLNLFVFYLGFPTMVINGIGTKDFLRNQYWEYIGSFFILRLISAVMMLAICLIRRGDIADFAVSWLATTWISSVTVSPPVMAPLFGEKKSNLYGVYCAFSSFFFQLPMMLSLLEIHLTLKSIREHDAALKAAETKPEEVPVETSVQVSQESSGEALPPFNQESPSKTYPAENLTENSPIIKKQNFCILHGKRIVINVLLRLVQNPIIWGILIGLIVSMSLAPSQSKLPVFFTNILTWFSACLTPISIFSIGVFASNPDLKFKYVIFNKFFEKIAYLIIKLFVLPLIMVGVGKMINLKGDDGNAAVLLATLPISLASFSLAKQYGKSEDIISFNVIIATLMLPLTQFLWMKILESWQPFGKIRTL